MKMNMEELEQLIAKEGDRKEFVYKKHKCLILRIEKLGHLCGYVCISGTDLPRNYDDDRYDQIDVHGGLTFSDYKEGDYYLGFDCAHCYDLVPRAFYSFGNETYRNMDFVETEIKKLVDQLIEMEGEENASN